MSTEKMISSPVIKKIIFFYNSSMKRMGRNLSRQSNNHEAS